MFEVYPRYADYYSRYRVERGDNTLIMHCIKSIASFINNHYKKTYNVFGYKKVKLLVESGKQDGEKQEEYYYLLDKLVYSDRFATDCFSGFFNERIKRSKLGIDKMPTYEGKYFTEENIEAMHSHFFNKVNKLFDDNDNNIDK